MEEPSFLSLDIVWISKCPKVSTVLGNQLKHVSGLSRDGIFKHVLACSPGLCFSLHLLEA